MTEYKDGYGRKVILKLGCSAKMSVLVASHIFHQGFSICWENLMVHAISPLLPPRSFRVFLYLFIYTYTQRQTKPKYCIAFDYLKKLRVWGFSTQLCYIILYCMYLCSIFSCTPEWLSVGESELLGEKKRPTLPSLVLR